MVADEFVTPEMRRALEEATVSVFQSPGVSRALEQLSANVTVVTERIAASVRMPSIKVPDLSSAWTHLGAKLTEVGRQVQEGFRRSWPPNWGPMEEASATVFLDRSGIVTEDGLPMAWVPPCGVVVDWTTARSREERLTVLLDRADEVADGCEEQLDVSDQVLARVADGLRRAVEAWRDGHSEAAQALATAALDTTITRSYRLSNAAAARQFDRRPEDEPIRLVREAMVLAAVRAALDSFRNGDPIPERYNRHATVHAVSPEQYTEENALIALMVATSLVRERQTELDEQR